MFFCLFKNIFDISQNDLSSGYEKPVISLDIQIQISTIFLYKLAIVLFYLLYERGGYLY